MHVTWRDDCQTLLGCWVYVPLVRERCTSVPTQKCGDAALRHPQSCRKLFTHCTPSSKALTPWACCSSYAHKRNLIRTLNIFPCYCSSTATQAARQRHALLQLEDDILQRIQASVQAQFDEAVGSEAVQLRIQVRFDVST